jgi:hypothetical protein
MFNRLERQAASDPKYSDRLRLENYTYFCKALQALAGQAPVLGEAVLMAESRREQSLHAYVQSQLEYGKLWKLLEFADKADKLLQVRLLGCGCKVCGCGCGCDVVVVLRRRVASLHQAYVFQLFATHGGASVGFNNVTMQVRRLSGHLSGRCCLLQCLILYRCCASSCMWSC